MDRVFDVLMGITAVAMVAVVVGNRNSARVISAMGNFYSDAINAATRPAR